MVVDADCGTVAPVLGRTYPPDMPDKELAHVNSGLADREVKRCRRRRQTTVHYG